MRDACKNENKATEYVSAFHPLINAISNFFQNKKLDRNQAHMVALKRGHLPTDTVVTEGYYVLVMFRVVVTRNHGNGKVNELTTLHSVLADLNGDEVIIIDRETGDQLNAVIELNGDQMFDNLELDKDIVMAIRTQVSIEIRKMQNEIKEDETIRFVSSVRRRAEQEIAYLETRIARIEHFIAEGRGIEAIQRKEILGFQNRISQIFSDQEKAGITVSNIIVSVNLVQVI